MALDSAEAIRLPSAHRALPTFMLVPALANKASTAGTRATFSAATVRVRTGRRSRRCARPKRHRPDRPLIRLVAPTLLFQSRRVATSCCSRKQAEPGQSERFYRRSAA